MNHGAVSENGQHDPEADTVVSVRAFKELQGSVHGHALAIGQLGELHTDMRALTKSNTVLAGTVGDALKAMKSSKEAMDARGLTRWEARLLTLAALVIAGAEVGARAGWW